MEIVRKVSLKIVIETNKQTLEYAEADVEDTTLGEAQVWLEEKLSEIHG